MPVCRRRIDMHSNTRAHTYHVIQRITNIVRNSYHRAALRHHARVDRAGELRRVNRALARRRRHWRRNASSRKLRRDVSYTDAVSPHTHLHVGAIAEILLAQLQSDEIEVHVGRLQLCRVGTRLRRELSTEHVSRADHLQPCSYSFVRLSHMPLNQVARIASHQSTLWHIVDKLLCVRVPHRPTVFDRNRVAGDIAIKRVWLVHVRIARCDCVCRYHAHTVSPLKPLAGIQPNRPNYSEI
jgi:hypothetical protein